MKVIILLCSLFLALQANIGKITTIQGEVKILRDSKSLQGKPSFVLENKDVVNTGNNSRTQLLFNDETLISLGENSTFSIEEYLVDDTKPNDSEMSLEISKGILKAITGKIGKINPNKFKLKTRSATIGIRGTIFFVQIMEDGSEYLVCKKGAIIVESPQGITYIPEGFYVLIQTDGNVGVPQPFTEQELKRIENETGNIESKEYVTVDDEKYTPIIKTDTPPTNGPEGGVPKYSYQGASEEFINHMNKGTEEVTEEGNKPVVIVLAPNIDQITENTAYDGMVIATFDSDEDSSNLTLSDNINYKIVGNEIQLTQAGADLVNDGNTLPPFSIYAKEATSNAITLPTITVDDPATIVVTTTVQNLTEDSISAGVTIATIDAHDEDSDLILTLSDTQNYVIVGNEVQLTQAGADIVNSGNDLPSFSVDANGVTSNTIILPTITIDDPATIVVTTTVQNLTEDSISAGVTIATIDAHDEDSDLILTLSDTQNYVIVGNEVQLTQAGADIVNSGNDLPSFSVDANGVTSNTIILPTITIDDPATIVVTTTVQNLTEDSISAGVTIATIDAHDEDSDLILTLSDTQNYVIVGNEVQLTQAGADIVNSGNDLPSFSVDANGVTSNMITISTIQVDDPAIITISPLSEEITENNVFAGMVVATIDAYDEDDDITVSISDTVNYTLVEYSEQATQQGKILRAGGKRLIQVQLTQAGADYVNAGNDLPPFTVSVNGVTSDEFTLPATVEVNDPPTIVLTPILTQITQRSATAGTVIATIDAYDEEGDPIVLTLSDTVNYIIVDNEVQLTQAGADLVNSGADLPNFTVDANGVTSNEIDPVNTTPAPTVNPTPQTSTKTATFSVLSSARREPADQSRFIGTNHPTTLFTFKKISDPAQTVNINNGTLNGAIILDDYNRQNADLGTDTTITLPQPTLPKETAAYSSFSNVHTDGTTKLFADDMQEFFVLENQYTESVVGTDDYLYKEISLFGIKTNDTAIPNDGISKYSLPQNSLSSYGTDTNTYINWKNRSGTTFYMDHNKIIIENFQVTPNGGKVEIDGNFYATMFNTYDETLIDNVYEGFLFGSDYQGIGTTVLAKDIDTEHKISYTTGKYRDTNFAGESLSNSSATSDFKGITYEQDIATIEFTLDRSTDITNASIVHGSGYITFNGTFSSFNASYVNDDLFSVLNFGGQNSNYESVQNGWLIAVDTGSLTPGTDDQISWGYWGADFGTVGSGGGDDIAREAWVATSLNSATPDDISSWSTFENGTYIGPMMGVLTNSVANMPTYIDPSNSSLNIEFNFNTNTTITTATINNSVFTPDTSLNTITRTSPRYEIDNGASGTSSITGEFYNNGAVSIGAFKLIDGTQTAKGVFKIKKQP